MSEKLLVDRLKSLAEEVRGPVREAMLDAAMALSEADTIAARLAEAEQHGAVLLTILRDGIVNAPRPTSRQWREIQGISKQLLVAVDSADAQRYVTILDADCNCPYDAFPVGGTDASKVERSCPIHGHLRAAATADEVKS